MSVLEIPSFPFKTQQSTVLQDQLRHHRIILMNMGIDIRICRRRDLSIAGRILQGLSCLSLAQGVLPKDTNSPVLVLHQMWTRDKISWRAASTCFACACVVGTCAQNIPSLSDYITQSRLLNSPDITSVFGNVTTDPSALFYFISSQIFAAQATDIFPTMPFLRLLPSAAFYKLRECQRKDITKCIRYGAGPESTFILHVQAPENDLPAVRRVANVGAILMRFKDCVGRCPCCIHLYIAISGNVPGPCTWACGRSA
jgi:hypothetical protein